MATQIAERRVRTRSRQRAPAATLYAANDAPRSGHDPVSLQLAQILLNAGIGVVRGGLDDGPRWANDAFATLMGFAVADLEAGQLAWSALTPPEYQARDREMLGLARRSGFTAPYEKEFMRADGSRWPVLVSWVVDPLDPGQVTMFVVDMSISRRIEPARGVAESQYARFLEAAGVAFWTADAAGRMTFSSRTAGEHDARDSAALAGLIHPDDRAFATATWNEAVASGRPHDIEVRARASDAAPYRWVRLQGFPDIVEGVVAGWSGTREDVHERRLATNALAESEARFKQLADDIPVMLWLADAGNGMTYLSRSWFDFTGQAPEEALGRGWTAMLHPDDRARLDRMPRLVGGPRTFEVDFRVRRADGSYRWMLGSGRPRYDRAGTFMGYAGALTDIDARKATEHELANTQQRLTRALDGTGVGVWEWDAASDEVRISSSALQASAFDAAPFGYHSTECRGVHPADRPRMLVAMDDYIEGRTREFEVEVRIRSRSGGWVWVLDRGTAIARDASGRALRMIGTLTNIEESKRAEERLRWAINHDALTGLANRTLFKEELHIALAAAGEGGNVALALLDVDNFKAVNDVLGHGAGDALLVVLADRLRDFVLPGETVARLGGDEFTLLLPGFDDAEIVMKRLEALRLRLAEPYVHDGETLSCRASIGVAIAPDHGTDASTLLRNADAAMYAAKAALDTVTLFDRPLAASMHRRATRNDRIRDALQDGAVDAVYQPLYRLADRRVLGVKAMVRVAASVPGERLPEAGPETDPETDEAGVVGAGNTDLALALGERLLDRAFADYRGWQMDGADGCLLGFDAGAIELRRGDYAGRILGRAARAGISPALLRVSVTSSLFGRGAGAIELTLARLRDAGVGIILDGVGTGQSELALIQRLPLTMLKIPGAFVAKLENGGADAAIVRAIVDFARAFDLTVVAENVATPAQAELLARMGCHAAHGSLFGTTIAADEVAALLRG